MEQNAAEMVDDYAQEALRLLESILNEQIGAAQRALRELPALRAGDPAYLPDAIRRTLKWAEPNGGSEQNLEHTIQSLVFWYGVGKGQAQKPDPE